MVLLFSPSTSQSSVPFPVARAAGSAEILKPTPVGPAVPICGGSHQPGLGLHAQLPTHLLSEAVSIPGEAEPRVEKAGRIGLDSPLKSRVAKETSKIQVPRSSPHPLPCLLESASPWLLHQLPTVPTCQAAEGPPNLPSVVTELGHCLTGSQSWHGAQSVGLVFMSWCLGSPCR